MLVSLICLRGKISNDNGGNISLIFICTQCDGTFETANCALLEAAALAHATSTHMVNKEVPTFEKFLQAFGSDRECHASAQTVGFPTSLFTHDCNVVLERKAPVDGALQRLSQSECTPV